MKILVALTCSALHASLSLVNTVDAYDPRLEAATGAAVATSCPLFRDGFEVVALPLFADGFDKRGRPSLPLGPGAIVSFLTHGGYLIVVDHTTTKILDPIGLNYIEYWGDPHESVNGKHIKDWGGEPEWDGARRTLLLDDGTKITLESTGPSDITLRTAIYDGEFGLEVDNCTNRVEWYAAQIEQVQQREQAQYDGEAATFSTDLATGVASYRNVYDEKSAFQRIEIDWLLADTGGYANPGQVNDYY